MPRKTNVTIKAKPTGEAKEGKKYEYFRVTATIGKNPDGSPIRKQFTGKSKREAESKRDDFLSGLKQGLAVDYQKTTFGNAFKHWLENIHKLKIRSSSYQTYFSMYKNHVAECELSGLRLADIRAANIQAYYNALRDKTTDKMIHKLHCLVRAFFGYCVKADIILKSPLAAVELPELPYQSEKSNTALSEGDLDKLINAATEDIKYFKYLFIAFTGLRSGELRALNYSDIDFKSGEVIVNKTVKYVYANGKGSHVLSKPKTKASMRNIPILEEIQGLLLEHIKAVKQAMPTIPFSGDFLLFPSYAGGYIDERNLLQSYQRLCRRLGIRQGRTIHSLRHTFCTILARQGVSLLDASRLMGHSNINVTAKIYSHVSDEDKKQAVGRLKIYFA